ncbi:MAG: hypothetical protein ACR5K7_06465 [Symbiopectobacterium sp.]
MKQEGMLHWKRKNPKEIDVSHQGILLFLFWAKTPGWEEKKTKG